MAKQNKRTKNWNTQQGIGSGALASLVSLVTLFHHIVPIHIQLRKQRFTNIYWVAYLQSAETLKFCMDEPLHYSKNIWGNERQVSASFQVARQDSCSKFHVKKTMLYISIFIGIQSSFVAKLELNSKNYYCQNMFIVCASP